MSECGLQGLKNVRQFVDLRVLAAADWLALPALPPRIQ